ncbi:unnamed protein product [Ostreobium quekettii]|uniref:Uncharacterized protein n=1 Tax=Ostreobium quekettii TaxID=121088 RepID=A0A8S1J7D6_9CHLO|nr:unnamed protein product [Ostreobium quekettii]|eukprot:evm.model.scf_1008.3 EVM.evm.TU.scf_1008.3   scf_1008:30954-37128(+)
MEGQDRRRDGSRAIEAGNREQFFVLRSRSDVGSPHVEGLVAAVERGPYATFHAACAALDEMPPPEDDFAHNESFFLPKSSRVYRPPEAHHRDRRIVASNRILNQVPSLRLARPLPSGAPRTPWYYVVRAGLREELFHKLHAVLIESGPHRDLGATLNLLFESPRRRGGATLEVVCLPRDVRVWSKAPGPDNDNRLIVDSNAVRSAMRLKIPLVNPFEYLMAHRLAATANLLHSSFSALPPLPAPTPPLFLPTLAPAPPPLPHIPSAFNPNSIPTLFQGQPMPGLGCSVAASPFQDARGMVTNGAAMVPGHPAEGFGPQFNWSRNGFEHLWAHHGSGHTGRLYSQPWAPFGMCRGYQMPDAYPRGHWLGCPPEVGADGAGAVPEPMHMAMVPRKRKGERKEGVGVAGRSDGQRGEQREQCAIIGIKGKFQKKDPISGKEFTDMDAAEVLRYLGSMAVKDGREVAEEGEIDPGQATTEGTDAASPTRPPLKRRRECGGDWSGQEGSEGRLGPWKHHGEASCAREAQAHQGWGPTMENPDSCSRQESQI